MAALGPPPGDFRPRARRLAKRQGRCVIVTALLAGLVAGGVHVLSGPDHLAAVLPLAAEGRAARAWVAGARWGLGHVSGVLVVGALAVLLRDMLPLTSLASVSERLVGAVLVGIGLWALGRALPVRAHAHEHVHDGRPHTHLHLHDDAPDDVPHAHLHLHDDAPDDVPHGHDHLHDDAPDAVPRGQLRVHDDAPDAVPHAHAHAHAHDHGATAFGVGVLHGLAGSGHLLGVLPALALPTAAAGVYLASFAAGTLLAMVAFAGSVGLALGRSGRRSGALRRALLAGSGVVAVGVGVFWLVAGPA